MDPELIGELEIHVLFFVMYVKQVRPITNKNHETYYYLQCLFHSCNQSQTNKTYYVYIAMKHMLKMSYFTLAKI